MIAAALDPNYGYIWLDADHPGTDAVKYSVKQMVNGTVWCCYGLLTVVILWKSDSVLDKFQIPVLLLIN